MKLLLGGAGEGRDRITSLLLNKSKPEENCPQDISNCNLFQSQLKGLRKWNKTWKKKHHFGNESTIGNPRVNK